MIVLSAQYGDPQCADVFVPFHRTLNDLFSIYMQGDYFYTIKELAIVFRVSGNIQRFNGDGPERSKYLKSRNMFSIDLVIPMRKWQRQSECVVRTLIADGINQCVKVLITRLEKARELKDLGAFTYDFHHVLECFNPQEVS